MFVYLSKLLPNLIYPAGLIMFMTLIGLIFCRSAKAKNCVLWLILIFVLIAGNKLPGGWLTRHLEQAYPAFNGVQTAEAIVVLGGGTVTKSAPRQIVEVNGGGDRVTYAVKLFRDGAADKLLLGGSYIRWRDGEVFSGNTVSSPASEMAELMKMYGIPEDALLIQARSLNTAEEAEEDAKILKELGVSQIILVSSATHMRRAVPLFEKQGLDVIPAPTDYSFSDQEWKNFLRFDAATAYTFFIPSIGNMESLQNAVKEYLGYYIYKLRGWI